MKELGDDELKFKHYLELRYNPNTVKQYLSGLRGYASYLENQEGVDQLISDKRTDGRDNPFYIGFLKAVIDCFHLPCKVTKSKMKNPGAKKPHKFLSKEQIELIINNSGEWISILTRLYWETGLRLRELIDCTRNDIDLQERTISGIGKGNKPFIVKFSYQAAVKLYNYMIKFPRKYVFHYGKDINYGKSYWYYLIRQCNALGIKNMHPHRIRHALGHYLRVDKGFDLVLIKTKLRHVKLNTTEIYSRATQEEVDDKMDAEVYDQ